jgi:hypothetical protein
VWVWVKKMSRVPVNATKLAGGRPFAFIAHHCSRGVERDSGENRRLAAPGANARNSEVNQINQAPWYIIKNKE